MLGSKVGAIYQVVHSAQCPGRWPDLRVVVDDGTDGALLPRERELLDECAVAARDEGDGSA